MRVCFINPSSNEDTFFGRVGRFAQAAAHSLDVDLEVVACGDPERAADIPDLRRVVEELVGRAVRPQYAIVANTRFSATTTIPLLTAAGIKVFLIIEGLFFAERRELGRPGQKHPNWIGEFLPDDGQAGRLLASTLVDAARAHGRLAPDGTIHLVGLSGSQTNASVARYQGLKDFAKAQEGISLDAVLPALWSQIEADRIAGELLERFPDTTAIWAANDTMALGAAAASEKLERRPGTDIFIGGIDWAPFAFEKIEQGVLTASLGGQFMDAAWALTMLHDHHHGGALEDGVVRSTWAVATAENLSSYRRLHDETRWPGIDFKQFSKVKNPALKAYDFSVESVLPHL